MPRHHHAGLPGVPNSPAAGGQIAAMSGGGSAAAEGPETAALLRPTSVDMMPCCRIMLLRGPVLLRPPCCLATASLRCCSCGADEPQQPVPGPRLLHPRLLPRSSSTYTCGCSSPSCRSGSRRAQLVLARSLNARLERSSCFFGIYSETRIWNVRPPGAARPAQIEDWRALLLLETHTTRIGGASPSEILEMVLGKLLHYALLLLPAVCCARDQLVRAASACCWLVASYLRPLIAFTSASPAFHQRTPPPAHAEASGGFLLLLGAGCLGQAVCRRRTLATGDCFLLRPPVFFIIAPACPPPPTRSLRRR